MGVLTCGNAYGYVQPWCSPDLVKTFNIEISTVLTPDFDVQYYF